MEARGGFSFGGAGAVMKKPRTAILRRPRPDSQLVFTSKPDVSPSYSTPSPDNAGKRSPDENAGYVAGTRKKEFYLNDHAPRVSSAGKAEGASVSKKIRKDDKTFGGSDGFHANGGLRRGQFGHSEQLRKRPDSKPSSEGGLTSPTSKPSDGAKESSKAQRGSPDGCSGKSGDAHDFSNLVGDLNAIAENKLRKVKLKVGGVTRTIHAKSNEETSSDGHGGSSTKLSHSLDSSRSRQKHIHQDNFDPQSKMTVESLHGKQADKIHSMSSNDPVRKSNRVPKRRVLDDAFGELKEDSEIRYLERLKTSKMSTDFSAEQEHVEDDVKKRKLSKGSKSRNTPYEVDEDYGMSRQPKDSRKKLRLGKEFEYTGYVEEEEPGSDAGPELKKKQKVSVETLDDVKSEPLTTRQRALQSGKGGAGVNSIEFPDGLPPPPSRKQKDKLTEEEKQAKKAEQALRRKMQVEKQAKEVEEAAIRKIRGLDSDRKKEEKNQKELEEKAKAAKLEAPALGTVRWAMGPTGTVVTFAEDVGFPSIFNSNPCSYPPPREKCAGPSCTNAYKYRDSRSNLPLCSLQCYKAVHGGANSVTC